MKNIENIFEYYLKNRINNNKEEELDLILASLIALSNYLVKKDFDLTKVIEMIVLSNTNNEKLVNQSKINAILEEFYSNTTKESLMSQKYLKCAKNIAKDENMLYKLEHLYGRLLLTLGIDIECGLQLNFNELYRRILSITTIDLEEEKNRRLKYCYHNIYDVTKEYAYQISFLENNIHIKINEKENEEEFDKIYEEQKKLYRITPILNGILEKTKKL